MGVRKKGDRWVTDAEHAKEEDSVARGTLILGVIVLCGYFANHYLTSHEVEKTYRLIGVITASLLGGWLCGTFIERILQFFRLLIVVFVVVVGLVILWQII